MEERLSLSEVKRQTSWLFDPNFLIYKLEDELIASKKQNPLLNKSRRIIRKGNRNEGLEKEPLK